MENIIEIAISGIKITHIPENNIITMNKDDWDKLCDYLDENKEGFTWGKAIDHVSEYTNILIYEAAHNFEEEVVEFKVCEDLSQVSD